jgi:undecaprenyl-diphosphatase
VVGNFTPLVPETDFSFPSGHMTFFFALSMAIYMYNKKWGIWFMAASLIMGIARIIAGVHYPTDILGGAIIGIIVGYFVTRLIKKPSKLGFN